MAEVVLTKQEIRPGEVERLREWTEEIRNREDEFLVYFMKADDVDAVFEAFEESDHEIDREHAEVLDEVLESAERVGDYELLYWLRNPERP